MRRVLCVLLAGCLLGQGVLPALAAEGADGSQVRITADRLNVRSGPGTQNPVVASVTRGQVLDLLGEDQGWVQVRLEDGLIGWVSKEFTESLGEQPSPGTPTEPPPKTPAEKPSTKPAPEDEEKSGGGSTLGTLFKWTCFVGAAATGYLAYSERGKGDDAYDEYEALANQRNDLILEGKQAEAEDKDEEAEAKFTDAEDHDSKAVTFGIVSGVLLGAFLVQQFILGGGDDDSAAMPGQAVPLSWDPVRREARASVVLARF